MTVLALHRAGGVASAGILWVVEEASRDRSFSVFYKFVSSSGSMLDS